MNVNEKRYYFSAVKVICIMMLIIYSISMSEKSLHEISVEWFLLAVTLLVMLGYETFQNDTYYIKRPKGLSLRSVLQQSVMGMKHLKIFFLGSELVLTGLLLSFFKESSSGMYLIPLVLLDTVIYLRLSFAFGILSFLGILAKPEEVLIYSIYCTFVLVIYFQNFIMIERYRKYLEEFEQKEHQLKDSIHSKDTIFKEQLAKSSLSFENKMLEEKTRLSQALHDKLGHSINGSVYQLEACKVLMENSPEESRKILQAVIDNLRTSMDEIRIILRREKPDKKRMAYLQLLQLCSDCKEKYGIEAEYKMEGENKEIPEELWDVILDNTIEAVTNALKYAQCTVLSIEIIILHKVIRCSIKDNGVGCISLTEGMGLQGMKNRVRKVNGYIDINSRHGFHINMIFPLS